MLLRILPSSEKRLIKLFHVYFKIAIFRNQISNVIFLYKLAYHFYFAFTLTCNLYKYYVVSLWNVNPIWLSVVTKIRTR